MAIKSRTVVRVPYTDQRSRLGSRNGSGGHGTPRFDTRTALEKRVDAILGRVQEIEDEDEE